ncbi:MAG: DUF1186 domain-containing protein [Kiritimatiellae bacterium]|nr:DUF1186 domain-containing protein [Kiritimatiellia bacterium]
MRVLRHNSLDYSGLEDAFARTAEYLEEGNFAAAEVKKLTPGPYYRARLSSSDRLIFRYGTCRGEGCLLLLEVVRNHAYEASRFLRGARIDETQLKPLSDPSALRAEDAVSLPYVNSAVPRFHVLDRILSFDAEQDAALLQRPPLILIGSAGSGKTVLTLEKLRQLPGEVLYVTHSPYLVDNARTIYFAHHYENDTQEVSFLSFAEFVQSISMPEGKPLTFADFAAWFGRYRGTCPVKDTHALYEEFNGVISGSAPDRPHLSREDYLSLGVRRSIFSSGWRPAVYDLFQRYLAFLPGSGCYDLNLVCHAHHARCRPVYDFVVADEVQDMTAVQLSLVLKSLRQAGQFVLCGDANQIVHPNFFSWAGVKSFFHDKRSDARGEVVRILNANYRNAPAVTDVANLLLRIKRARFGSIDRESHYLINPVSDREGSVTFLQDSDDARREFDRKTGRSARFAVIVLRDEDKDEARRVFRTPLVFSVREAKGLEYENIIMVGFVSGQSRAFREIAEGVTAEDLQAEYSYGRARDKSDKSLDACKFFINAFYVALTRAIANVYVLESEIDHPLLRLLNLRVDTGTGGLAVQTSSDAEWRAEALRLERQGKTDQVENIRRTILRMEAVPWRVLTPTSVGDLTREALEPSRRNLKSQRLLLDYAATYTVIPLLQELVRAGFKPASQPEIARVNARQRYGADYHQRGFRDLLRKTEMYGVDFRNPINQTPLMLAAQLGVEPIAAELVQRGASLFATDNWGRIPLQLALRAAFLNPQYAKNTLGSIYPHICPPALTVRIGARLVKIDSHRMEFFLLHSMLALFEMILRTKIKTDTPGFETGDFIHQLEAFPEAVIPSRRRSRQAITAALAGHEISRQAHGSRCLFLRMSRGFYIPNPCMAFEQDGAWVNVLDLLNIGALADEQGEKRLAHFAAYLLEKRKSLAECNADVPQTAGSQQAEQDAHTAQSLPASDTEVSLENGLERLLPDHLTLNPAPSCPYGADVPGNDRDMRACYAEIRYALNNFTHNKYIDLDFILKKPALSAACLLRYLGETSRNKRQFSADKAHGCRAALLLLCEWHDKRAYPYALRLLSNPCFISSALGAGKCQMLDLAAMVAGVSGGHLAPLRDLIMDKRANPFSRAVATAAIPVLAIRCGLDRAVTLRFYAGFLDALLETRANACKRFSKFMIGQLVEDACNLHPVELRSRLEAVVRKRLVLRHVLTLSLIAHSASLQEWELASANDARYPSLPQGVLYQLKTEAEEGHLLDAALNDEEDYFEFPRENEPYYTDQKTASAHLADDMSSGAAARAKDESKVGRNSPCPCGSGRKFKKCCGR